MGSTIAIATIFQQLRCLINFVFHSHHIILRGGIFVFINIFFTQTLLYHNDYDLKIQEILCSLVINIKGSASINMNECVHECY